MATGHVLEAFDRQMLNFSQELVRVRCRERVPKNDLSFNFLSLFLLCDLAPPRLCVESLLFYR